MPPLFETLCSKTTVFLCPPPQPHLMRKLHLALCVLLLLALAPQTYAWNWKTHWDVVQVAYQELPENVKVLLSYTIIRDGAVWPDRYRDTPDPYGRTFPTSGHIQPASRAQAVYWLEQARVYYWENNYDNAALALGTASHYIADSVSLVHNVGWTDLHFEFEDQGEWFTPAKLAGISNFDLEQKLTEYYNGAQAKWQRWLGTRDQTIVREGVDLAASYTYNAWCQALSVTPREAQETSLSIDFRLIAGIILVILVVVIVIGMKRFYRE